MGLIARQRWCAALPAAMLLVLIARLGAAGGAAQAPQSAAEPWRGAQPEVVDAAINAVRPALVKIEVVEADYEDGREVKSEGTGSGVIISPQGHVVTNHHVAGNAKRIVCMLANQEQIEADLVGTDPLSDIAVIRLKPRAARVFPTATFGDSSLLKVGDRVLAMGSPLAFSQSVTMGIVANTQLVMPREYGAYRVTLEGEDVGSIISWIAHDADIYGGNSGGPLVNLAGEIVGINELRMGLSAAIPANVAKQVAAQLIQCGEVNRSWLGLEVQPRLESQAAQRGVLVSGTIPGSPAERAGLRPRDMLIRLAGREVNVQFREELAAFNRLVCDLPVGEQVEAVVLRDGKPLTLQARTEKREPMEPRESEIKAWGMCARDLSLMLVKERGLESRDGVLVTSVRPGGPCGEARPPIAGEDVIVRVGETPIKNVQELVEITGRITAGAPSAPVPVLVAFVRKQAHYLTVVKVGPRRQEEPGREVRKAWLPVVTQVLTRDIAQALGIAGRTGVLVTQVYPHSTAETAGLQAGDIILALDGEPISATEPQDLEVLPAMVRQRRIGGSAQLTILRGGEQRTLSIELVASPALAREMRRYRDDDFEFTVRDITFFDRVEQRWPQDQAGAVVQEVGQGGWAALGDLGAGDLIITVDGAPVTDVPGLEKAMTEVAQRQPESVVLQIVRGIHHLYIEMRPAWLSVGQPSPAATAAPGGGNHGEQGH